jgi:hypothetical protein
VATVKAQNTYSSDSIVSKLRDFLETVVEEQGDVQVSDDGREELRVYIHEIVSKQRDLTVDFGVFLFMTHADGDKYYMVKYKQEYYLYSAFDQKLVTDKLVELQEQHPTEFTDKRVMSYIKTISKIRPCDTCVITVGYKKFDIFDFFYKEEKLFSSPR